MQTHAITLVKPQLPVLHKPPVTMRPRVQHPVAAPRFGAEGKPGLFAAFGNWFGALKARLTSWVNTKAASPENTIASIDELSAEMKANRKNVTEASIKAATNHAIHAETLQSMEKKQLELDERALRQFEAFEALKQDIAAGKKQVEESVLKEVEAMVEEDAFKANLHQEQLAFQRKITADSKLAKDNAEKMERDYEKFLRMKLAKAEHAKIMIQTMEIQQQMQEMAERQSEWQTSASVSTASAAGKLDNMVEDIKKRKIASDIRTEKALGKLEAGTITADQKAASELLKADAPTSAIEQLKARQKGKGQTKEVGKSSGTGTVPTAPTLPTVNDSGAPKKDTVPVVED